MKNQIIKLSCILALFFSLNSGAFAQKIFNDTIFLKISFPEFMIDGDFGPATFDGKVQFIKKGEKRWSWGMSQGMLCELKPLVKLSLEPNSMTKKTLKELKKGSKVEAIKIEHEGEKRTLLLKDGVVRNIKTTGDINIVLQFESWPCK